MLAYHNLRDQSKGLYRNIYGHRTKSIENQGVYVWKNTSFFPSVTIYSLAEKMELVTMD